MKRHSLPLMLMAFGLILVGGVVLKIVGTVGENKRTGAVLDGEGRRLVNAVDRVTVARDLGRRQVRSAIPYLLLYLRDDDPAVRQACATALGEIGDRKVAIDLKLRLERENHPSVRTAIQAAMDALSEDTFIKNWVAGLRSVDPAERERAIHLLAQFHTNNDALAAIVSALGDPDASVRAAATAEALQAASLAIPLMERASVSASTPMLANIIDVLKRTELREAVRPLLTIGVARGQERVAGDKTVRDLVIHALSGMGNMALIAMVQETIQQPDQPELQRIVAASIQQLNSTAAVPMIADMAAQWKEPPSDEDVQMWLATVQRLGGDAAPSARQRIERWVAVLRERRDLGSAAAELELARLAPIGEEIAGKAGNGIYVLVLVGAVDGCTLALHLDCRDRRLHQAFGVAQDFNRASHDVDASTLEFNSNTISGTVQVRMHTDGHHPEDPKPVARAFEVNAISDGSRVTGTYRTQAGARTLTGKIVGLLQERPVLTNPAWFYLTLPQGVWQERGKSYHDLAYLRLTLWNGQAYDGEFNERAWPVNRTSNAWGGRVDDAKVTFTGDRLEGRVATTVPSENERGSKGACGVYDLDLNAAVIGRVVGGSYTTRRDEKRSRSGRFFGIVTPTPKPAMLDGNARLSLVFQNGLGADRPLSVRLDVRNGRLAQPMFLAFQPKVNVKRNGLQIKGRSVQGTLTMSIEDEDTGKPVLCAYELHGVSYHGRITGAYHGLRNDTLVEGDLAGSCYIETDE